MLDLDNNASENSNLTKREKLLDFYEKIKSCRNCELHKTRINFVFGSGNSNAEILFIGEAPGKNEDLQGKPFVGQAGKLLDKLLLLIGFKRNEVFIANVLKCRPPNNRDPNIFEINTCKQYLFKQIEIINPLIICTMGKYSTQLILETSTGINKLRGKVLKKGNKIIIPINHPAAALYTPSRILILEEDFKRLGKIYKKFKEIQEVKNTTQLEEIGAIDDIDQIDDIELVKVNDKLINSNKASKNTEEIEKSERIERTEKPEKPEKLERKERAKKSEKIEKSEKNEIDFLKLDFKDL